MGAFGFSLDFLCLLFVTAVTFSFFVIENDILGDKVGLAITQAISLTFLMQYGVRQSAEVANQLMAVERLMEYTQLPAEKGIKPDDIDIRQARKANIKLPSYRTPPRGWPDCGRVEFRALSLRYGPGDDPDGWVLRDLSFVVQPREKVGIVGRTGAGKSSLIQAMFRLAHLKGDIIIDEVNAGDVTLEDLRKHLSIIPQDPMLFNGTLRRNLDPFEEFSDDALWTVLSEV
ncbi:Probable multidrug resistance-associated protein lethal(2)03659 [Eumeta japonica]|uniref:Probable multidrug resistance-associated protein lethal(2)03659 n=1 Tax=Eumeta variegata TaxID=151549 RepID=A0A4C1T272_EUMVA|nr:Probable multidrug resistance-associated protein lethal(2)03659 [Eumeta japonica]